jgi:hypothetical protein
MTQGVCEQLDMLLLVPLVVLLAVAAIALRRVRGACKRCGTIDRRLAGWRRAGRYCATCGWPRCGSPRGGGNESVAEVAKAIAPASSKVALDPRSPVSRLRVGWCQGATARDFRGRAVFPRQSVAVSWSLLGAIAASLDCGTPEWTTYLRRISRVLGAPRVSARWLAGWNDDPSRTQAEVVAAAAAAAVPGLGPASPAVSVGVRAARRR